jgi:hypothetical protein
MCFVGILEEVVIFSQYRRGKMGKVNLHHNAIKILYEHRPSELGFPITAPLNIKENAGSGGLSFNAEVCTSEE